MQHETSNVGKGNVEAVSVAIPAVMRTGADGKNFQKFFLISRTLKSVSCIIPQLQKILIRNSVLSKKLREKYVLIFHE